MVLIPRLVDDIASHDKKLVAEIFHTKYWIQKSPIPEVAS